MALASESIRVSRAPAFAPALFNFSATERLWLTWLLIMQAVVLQLLAVGYVIWKMTKSEACDKAMPEREEDLSMKPHSKQMMRQFEFAGVIMEYKSAVKNAKLPTLATYELPPDGHVPQFLLLGNQSSGKTTILQRLTKQPLGVTGTSKSTCRPFQFTLIHDPSQEGYEITVDGEHVEPEDLLKKLSDKNAEKGGRFDPRRCCVTIRSKHVTSLIIVDMPGLTSESKEPFEMAKKELEDPSAIPILVLQCSDPRSVEPARQAFEDLLDGRESKAVAILNKFDEKILEPESELGNGSKWNQWVDSWYQQPAEQLRRYCAWFMVGVPPGDPKEELVARLKASGKKEKELIHGWKNRCGAEARWPEEIQFGLSSFEEFVHNQQSEKLAAFVKTMRPQLGDLRKSAQALIPPKLEGHARLLKELAFVVSEGQNIWQGNLEAGQFSDAVKKTLPQELDWLKGQDMVDRAKAMIEMLETGDWQKAVGPRTGASDAPTPEFSVAAGSDRSDRQDDAATIRKKLLNHWIVQTVYASETQLLGLTATNRFAACIERFGFCCLWLHTTTSYTLEFFRNAVSYQQRQTANTAIREYKKAMCARVFRPLTELMRIMLEEQFVRSMDAPFDSQQKDQTQWFQGMKKAGLPVEDIRAKYGREVREIAVLCGEEFLEMMLNDIKTLESELFHAFSDDASADFIRRNQILGDSTKLGHGGDCALEYSPEALARRYLCTFKKHVKPSAAQHMQTLRDEAEQAVNHGAISRPTRAGAHEVADYFRPVDQVDAHVISEESTRCISSAMTWNQLFAGPNAVQKDGFKRLHLVSCPFSSAEFSRVDLIIFGHTYWSFLGYQLPKKERDLNDRTRPYCGVLLKEAKKGGKIIKSQAAEPKWTEVSFEIPETAATKYEIHIVDFQPRGIACKHLSCTKREQGGSSSSAPTAESSDATRLAQSSETSGTLAKIMRTEVAVDINSHPQNDNEETMFHELHSRIAMEMCSTFKQFHSDLHKNINKFLELSHGRAPFFIEGLAKCLRDIQDAEERENAQTLAQVVHLLTLIQRAYSLVDEAVS